MLCRSADTSCNDISWEETFNDKLSQTYDHGVIYENVFFWVKESIAVTRKKCVLVNRRFIYISRTRLASGGLDWQFGISFLRFG